jgi:hypothetical protein
MSFLSDGDEELTRQWLEKWGAANSVQRLDGRKISDYSDVSITRSVLFSQGARNIAKLLDVSFPHAEMLVSFLKVVNHSCYYFDYSGCDMFCSRG